MFFSTALYLALGVCGLGLLWRFGRWCSRPVGEVSRQAGAGARAAAALGGTLRAVFSPRLGALLNALILDVILQRKLWRDNPWRGAAHVAIYGGFMLLLVFHALESQVTARLFKDYASTLNPWLWLRNLWGLLVVAGLVVAMIRRRRERTMRQTSGRPDWLAIGLLALIMLSGFCLETNKIFSTGRYQEMVEEFGGLSGEDEEKALKAFWAKDFGMVFPDLKEPYDQALLDQGAELHENSCSSCHSRPTSAFISYPISRIFSPLAPALNAIRFDRVMWYVHILACLLGLAYLPFSKFLHLITTPLMLLVNAGMGEDRAARPAARGFRRALELDACTHCAICSDHCSVKPLLAKIPNLTLLPSEKLATSRLLEKLGQEELLALQEGSHLCTACQRCTERCPAGINLQELWFALKEELKRRGLPGTYAWMRARQVAQATPAAEAAGSPGAKPPPPCFPRPSWTTATASPARPAPTPARWSGPTRSRWSTWACCPTRSSTDWPWGWRRRPWPRP